MTTLQPTDEAIAETLTLEDWRYCARVVETGNEAPGWLLGGKLGTSERAQAMLDVLDTVDISHDAGKDDDGLAPGHYAAFDGLALAGPAPSLAMAQARLEAFVLEEHGEPRELPPTLWTVPHTQCESEDYEGPTDRCRGVAEFECVACERKTCDGCMSGGAPGLCLACTERFAEAGLTTIAIEPEPECRCSPGDIATASPSPYCPQHGDPETVAGDV